eukprot:CAMPEP_0183378402 /NCGR_PEP_ID=MMETSP0164_2-20130417/124897_1 /TAXON_ID=221442 /ORGANISM="Coccolithus pelagicus ssp braarudi, Strain PLY182g" /LENGTH=269 /DNA_ID=CAMNT_0025555959 /DNA_START=211 /DNA_END=1018 /DNA_ORIENTATION=+
MVSDGTWQVLPDNFFCRSSERVPRRRHIETVSRTGGQLGSDMLCTRSKRSESMRSNAGPAVSSLSASSASASATPPQTPAGRHPTYTTVSPEYACKASTAIVAISLAHGAPTKQSLAQDHHLSPPPWVANTAAKFDSGLDLRRLHLSPEYACKASTAIVAISLAHGAPTKQSLAQDHHLSPPPWEANTAAKFDSGLDLRRLATLFHYHQWQGVSSRQRVVSVDACVRQCNVICFDISFAKLLKQHRPVACPRAHLLATQRKAVTDGETA